MRKILLLLLSVLFLVSCEKEQASKHLLQGTAFGTTYSVQYFGEPLADLERKIDSVIEAVNRSMSTYIPNSDISKINRGDSSVVVDPMFKEVFAISEEVHEQSSGYFDPTIGVLRNAYGFGSTAPLRNIDSLVVDSLMQYVGFQKVQLKPNGTIAKSHPQIYFDFNAVAKGYGIDRIGLVLDKQNLDNYLIELGGELLAKGINQEKQQAWVVGVEAVDSPLGDRSYQATVALTDAAMASSGNYRKFRLDSLSGKRFVHTLNPLTGQAEASNLTSATIIAGNCALADAYATACMAMGLDGSKELLKGLEGVEAYLTYTEAQKDKVFVTPGFQKLLGGSSTDRE